MNLYCGLLNMFDLGDVSDDMDELSYDCNEQNYKELINEFHIDRFVKEDSDFDTAFGLMRWINEILIHLPDYHNQKTDNAAYLLKRLMNNEPINCRSAANIIVECCLALGLKSRAVWLLPANPYDSDCHVVPMVLCRELNKWVMFDATVNSIVKDKNGIPLSLLEIRNKLANDEEILFSDTLRYVRADCDYAVQVKMFRKYLSKNLFMMRTYKINCNGYEGVENQEYVYLASKNFDINRYYELQNNYFNNVSEQTGDMKGKIT